MPIVDRALELCTQAILGSPQSSLVHIVLTGGRTGTAITRRLGEVVTQVPKNTWERVHLWWGDERFVALNSPERNDFGIEQILGEDYSALRVHRALGKEECLNVDECAKNYLDQLQRFGPEGPDFSLVIVGMGSDGHIASLFPHSPQLNEVRLCVAVKDSPKPPSERITLTFTALNHARTTAILAGGSEKESALDRLLAAQGSIDDTPVRGISGPHVEILR